MKLFQLIIILFCSIPIIWSQDYQTFNSSDVHYFRENNEGMMLASEIVTTEFLDGDSIFYPFKSFRFDVDDYLAIETASWMGERIIIQPDGTNLFFNRNLDSIFINTQARIGEAFIMYEYEGGATIIATVESITEELVLGELDSVKTFLLTSDEPSFVIESPAFRIGKNAGLLDVIPFYSFPEKYLPVNGMTTVSSAYTLVGQLYPNKGVTKPTYSDLCNLEVGDELKYITYGYNWRIYNKRRLTVLNKSLIDGDSVEYIFEQLEDYHESGGGVLDPDPVIDTSNTTVFNEIFSVSDDFVNSDLIPEKDYGFELDGGAIRDNTFVLFYDESCGYREVFYSNDVMRVDGEIIGERSYIGESTYSTISNGLYIYNTWHLVDWEERNGSRFITFKHGDVVCGSEEFLSIDDEEVVKELKVFPNPSNGNVTVDIDGEFDYQIYSIDGRFILSNKNQASPHIILNEVPNGTYFLVIQQNGMIYNQKLVVFK